MRILVAGATGVVGRRVTAFLAAAGHQVTGTTRRSERTGDIEVSGAAAVVMDALDEASVARAVERAAPDAVVHELTDLGGRDFDANAHLRVEGTANLVEAAVAGGVQRMVAQSISWAYKPGEVPATEEVAPAVDPGSGALRSPAVASLERAVLGLPAGVVLRYGLLYGPGTWYEPGGPVVEQAREGVVEATTDRTSFVHVDDAAGATVAALVWPPGAYNIVDDEPTRLAEWGPLLIGAVGASVVRLTSRQEGRSADNRRARALGWVPAHPSWRSGLLEAVAAPGPAPGRRPGCSRGRSTGPDIGAGR